MSEFIFAVGPNGAGKSSLGKYLAPENAVIIDGDKIRSESRTMHEAEQKHTNLIQGAVLLNRPIYYESNFLDPRERDFYLSFRSHGYDLQLIYMGLDSVQESIQRVSKRTQTGGHTVPLSTIEMNFKHSIRNSISHYKDFDSVTLVDNPVKANSDATILFVSLKGQEVFRNDPLPRWADQFLNHIKNPLLPLPYADELDENPRRKR